MEELEKNIELERDLALVEAYKTANDSAALASFFTKYMSLIYGVCLKYLKDEEKSKDTVMEIYEKLAVKLKKHDVSNPKSWLYILTKNHCYELLRSSKRVTEKENRANLMYTERVYRLNDSQEKEAELSMMDDCIESLEERQQKTVRMFYLEKKTYKEICALLEINWNKARSLIQNGRRNLKKCMEIKYESVREK